MFNPAACETCRLPLKGEQKRFCSHPCHTKGMHAATPARFWARVNVAPDDCWEWQGRRSDRGYGETSYLGKRGMRTHRLALILAGETVAKGALVMHSCDNPPCCNPAHLKVGTSLENNRDMMAKGRFRHVGGEDHPCAKLTNAQSAEIRARTGERLASLAAEFGVSKSSICRIQRSAK